MTGSTSALVYVDIFQGTINPLARLTGRRQQRWRWRALNGDNYRVLAASSEAYVNREDCVSAIRQLFGSQSNVYLRAAEQGNLLLRLATQIGD
jgi:uncharacterized protein YegP (UPF0339 family)